MLIKRKSDGRLAELKNNVIVTFLDNRETQIDWGATENGGTSKLWEYFEPYEFICDKCKKHYKANKANQ
jgi:hypothetical protein